MNGSQDPETQLRGFIARFTPEIALLADACLAKLRTRLPNAIQLVYDNYHALVIGFGPSERASEAIVSIAVYPRKVNLNFLQAGTSSLRDPGNLLQGSGRNRFIPIDSPATLENPAITDLLDQALRAAKIPLSNKIPGFVVIKSVSG